MREIGEGDAKFVYIIELVPPKDLGSIVHLGVIHYKCYFLEMLFIATLFTKNTNTWH